MGALWDWLNHLEHLYVVDIVKSSLLILALVITRAMILRSLSTNPRVTIELRRHWAVNLRNAALVIGAAGLAIIWASEIASFAVSLAAVAAATVLATKELIMCAGGSFLRTLSNSYGLGDHIEIGNYRGRVVDINLLSTTIMEIGPRHDAHQLTGRAITLPNSLLFSQPVIRENYMGDYVVHALTLCLPYTLNPNAGERIVLSAAQEVCAPFLAGARRHMEEIELHHLIDTPSVEPRCAFVPLDDKRYNLIVRVAIPAKERHRVEQAIMHRIMTQCFPETATANV
jgi:small-conductance mechanosensitive channel